MAFPETEENELKHYIKYIRIEKIIATNIFICM